MKFYYVPHNGKHLHIARCLAHSSLQLLYPCNRSLTYSLTYSLTHLLAHPLTHTRSLTHPLPRSPFINSPTQLFILLLIRSYPFTDSTELNAPTTQQLIRCVWWLKGINLNTYIDVLNRQIYLVVFFHCWKSSDIFLIPWRWIVRWCSAFRVTVASIVSPGARIHGWLQAAPLAIMFRWNDLLGHENETRQMEPLVGNKCPEIIVGRVETIHVFWRARD